MTELITSAQNPRIKRIVLLQKKKKEREEQERFVIEGLRIFEDALRSAPDWIDEIILSNRMRDSETWNGMIRQYSGEMQGRILQELSDSGRMITVSDEVFDKAAETVNPQGILCVMRMMRHSYEEISKRRLLLLENIQDPGNLGTMIRTAEAAGFTGIIMSGDTADIYSPKVTRSTMGSLFRVPFMYCEDFCGMLRRLKKDDVTVYGAYLRDGTEYDKIEYASSAAVLIGNEGNGITDEAIAEADRRIFIPMSGQIESLNAAIAAAVIMYGMR